MLLALFLTIAVVKATSISENIESLENDKEVKSDSTDVDSEKEYNLNEEVNTSSKFDHFFNGSYGVLDVLEELVKDKSLSSNILSKRK